MSSWDKEDEVSLVRTWTWCEVCWFYPVIKHLSSWHSGTKVPSVQCRVVVRCHAGPDIHTMQSFEICDIGHRCARLCNDLPRVCVQETLLVPAHEIRWGGVWFLIPLEAWEKIGLLALNWSFLSAVGRISAN